MIWRRRGKKRRGEEQAMPTTATTPVVDRAPQINPEDVLRAQNAAALARLSLQEAKQRRPEVDRTVAQIKRLNRENGFAEMIRSAFGS